MPQSRTLKRRCRSSCLLVPVLAALGVAASSSAAPQLSRAHKAHGLVAAYSFDEAGAPTLLDM
jgi:hypothetical protein